MPAREKSASKGRQRSSKGNGGWGGGVVCRREREGDSDDGKLGRRSGGASLLGEHGGGPKIQASKGFC